MNEFSIIKQYLIIFKINENLKLIMKSHKKGKKERA